MTKARSVSIWSAWVFALLGLLAIPAIAQAAPAPHADGRLATAAALHRNTGDPDRDGLPTWFERRRSHTAPHRKDSDGDGLSDGAEVKRYHTNPRKADTDGDGFSDGVEVTDGTDPRSDKSVPSAGGGGGGQSQGNSSAPSKKPTSSSNPTPTRPGRTPTGPGVIGESPAAPPAEEPSTPPAEEPTAPPVEEPTTPPVEEPGTPPNEEPTTPPVEEPTTPPVEEPTEPPFISPEVTEPSACTIGATQVTTASALTAAVRAKKSVCVTAAIGNVSLSEGNRAGVVISTQGAGSLGELLLEGTNSIAVRWARLRSVTIRHSNEVAIEGSTIGGTRENRVSDQLIFMPDRSDNVIIRGNDIGWTIADNSGNTGYGCRCYGETNNLLFIGNYLHDLAADGFQGTNGANVVIDRNKIGPIGANPGSNEHSDNIQMVGNGPGLRITNNWLLQQGFYEGQVVGNSGSIYVHGGTSNSTLIENNLIEENQGRTEICGLGTGGTSRSNITIRGNTWIEGGLTFTGFPGFEWDCDSGSGNLVADNIAVDPDGGFAQDGSSSAATFTNNIWGTPSKVTFDAQGNCTSANCNPAGADPIGYRKPAGVPW
jgi:hypothetical protein